MTTPQPIAAQPAQKSSAHSPLAINALALGGGVLAAWLALVLISLLIREPTIQPENMSIRTVNTTTESLPEFSPAPDPEPPSEIRPDLPELDLAMVPALDTTLKLPELRMEQVQWTPQLASPPAPQRIKAQTVAEAPPPATIAPVSNPEIAVNRRAINITNPAFLRKFYPRRAERRGITGSSVVNIAINTDGKVTTAEVIRSEPPGIFERAAQRAALQMRYQPAIQQGKPVATTQQVTLTWSLQ